MGHDISGFNKAGKEIAYARYSMGNYNAELLYRAFKSVDLDCGVSGCGDDRTFTIDQIRDAREFFSNLKDMHFNGDIGYEREKLGEFIDSCLETAKHEGSVRIGFY